uniref:Uncharacterized protein n=1 Tax=Micrurus lemniscatus lemniscatus TaxID=129467 RepID=A0A2D4HVC1_MICLE
MPRLWTNNQPEKKPQVMGQNMDSPPCITISAQELEVVHDFMYLGSTISNTLSLDTELNRHIGKAATTFSRLTKRVWLNKLLTEYTKIQVYRASVLNTLCTAVSLGLFTHSRRES